MTFKDTGDLASSSWKDPIHGGLVVDHWTVEKDFRFEASHQLPYHDGQCARIHGHSYKVTVKLEGEYLERGSDSHKLGMVVDFADLKPIINKLKNDLDHQHLNDRLGIKWTTCEFLARWIYRHVDRSLQHIPKAKSCRLVSVTVHETETCRATYEPKG